MGSCHGSSVHEVVTVYFLRYHYWLLNITRDSNFLQRGGGGGLKVPPDPQLFTMASGRTGLQPGATALSGVVTETHLFAFLVFVFWQSPPNVIEVEAINNLCKPDRDETIITFCLPSNANS